MQAQTIEAPKAPQITPAITWLNMSGDVTITWDDSNRESILQLVEQKMKEGYSFFVLTPRVIPILGNKKVKLTNVNQLDKALGVIVPDSQVASIVSNLGDAAVEHAVNSGAAMLATVPTKGPVHTTRRATTASEVVESQTVAVRAVVGG